MLLLGFLANLYKIELKWCEEASKVREWTAKGIKSEPKAPKVSQLEPKGRTKGAKKGAPRSSSWTILGAFLHQKSMKKSMRKSMPKKS